ncbi:chymotrypsin-2-like [Leptopilina boulardi]|uniref:chymotrypsin-2-like n=1 Tax=Leptopilina boulardi TaxID=63433 RepID=UPI0021F57CC0|nr:chymotrypsin-2-like [Leptopilina boulardi]
MANLTIFVLLIFTFTLSLANRKISPRLVGGSQAHAEQFPYQVTLFELATGHICGGSILNEKWILTAARCVRGRHPTSFYVGAGITNWSDLYNSFYMIEKIIVDDSQNIALIKLQDTLTFSTKLNKIDLPLKNLNTADTPVVISGWGSTFKEGKTSKKLLFLQSKIFDLNTCKNRMSEIKDLPPVTDENLCTFTREGEGSCNGDTGNPVVFGDYQVGVVLHGYPCAKGYPDISANVWNYIKWIKNTINEQ